MGEHIMIQAHSDLRVKEGRSILPDNTAELSADEVIGFCASCGWMERFSIHRTVDFLDKSQCKILDFARNKLQTSHDLSSKCEDMIQVT
jgi:hypothetical protein